MGFYRSKDDKILLGLCGGLADKYWAYDAREIRVGLFLATLLTGGLAFFAYLLAVFLPEKETEDARGSQSKSYLMKAKGNNGQVELHRNKIKITRDGVLAKLSHGFKGSKEIPLESITSIQLKEPGAVSAGFIQFGQSGYSESSGGVMSAAQDENSVNFNKGSTREFKKLKERIYELKDEGKQSGSSNTDDSALESLKKKFVEGEISEEEFQRKKDLLEE